MDDKLKQRIVGAMVIFALAAIILPIILDDTKSQQRFQSQIPERPVLDAARDTPREAGRAVESSSSRGDARPQLDSELNERSTTQPEDVDPNRGISPARDVIEKGLDTGALEAGSDEADSQKTDSHRAGPSDDNPGDSNSLDAAATTAAADDSRSAPPPAELGFTSNAWVIQVGSFSDNGNASKLVNKLKSSGFKAFARRYQLAQGSSTRVYVGPDLDRGDLEKQLDPLNKATGMKAIVVKFDPSVH